METPSESEVAPSDSSLQVSVAMEGRGTRSLWITREARFKLRRSHHPVREVM